MASGYITRKNEAQPAWIEEEKRWRLQKQKKGKRKSFYSSIPGQRGKKEVLIAARAWMESDVADPDARVRALFPQFLNDLKMRTSYDHHRQYDGYWRNWISPIIGMRKAAELCEQDLQDVINNAYARGKLSKKTLKNMAGCLKAFLKFCRKKKASTLHLEDNLLIPKKAAPSRAKPILTPNDVRVLFTSSETTYYGKPMEEFFIYAFRFCILKGWRPGELIGMERRNITADAVRIAGAINIHGERTTGKNENAIRASLLTELEKKVLQDQCDMLKRKGIVSPYMFPAPDGSPICEETFEKRLKKYCIHNGITVITPYRLRNTFVSAVRGRMDEDDAKQIVGHSESMDTYGVYGLDFYRAEDERRRDEIEGIFEDILQGKVM